MPALIKHNITIDQQQQQQHQPQNAPMTQTKITKVRRTRQPRNPQLSVARRNERERNRVKMVNNGFALLRDHLPIEDLQACEQSSDGDTPAPDGNPKGKSKKFSKVETLRAAIARIRFLNELIRSTEPEFESINIMPKGQSSVSSLVYDEEPLSVGEPLSTCSSTTQSNSNNSAGCGNMYQQQHHQQQHQQMYTPTMATGAPTCEQFVKLEPQQPAQLYHQHQQPNQSNQNSTHFQQNQLMLTNLPSPQHSQASNASQYNSANNQYATQVHQPISPQQVQQPEQQQQQQQQPSHTHLWIQQHQSSFQEQQQQYQQQQQQWYPQQTTPQTTEAISNHIEGNWTTYTSQQQQQQLDLMDLNQISSHQQTQIQSPGSQQMDSPVWYSGNGSPASVQSVQPSMAFAHHQHQQQHHISLYSQ